TGIAPMRVLAEQESARRNVTLLMGGRSVAHLWPSDRLPATVEYVTTTEDGSFGITGRVTDAIGPLLEWADQVCACGPWPMLAALGRLRDEAERAAATYPGRAALLETQIAVEQHMGCAMGVCRACVIVTAQGNARVCREGPVFGLGDVAFAEGGRPPRCCLGRALSRARRRPRDRGGARSSSEEPGDDGFGDIRSGRRVRRAHRRLEARRDRQQGDYSGCPPRKSAVPNCGNP